MGGKKVTIDKVEALLAERGFQLNGEYAGNVGGKTPLKCLTCEYEWSPRINDIKSGKGCPSCSGRAPVTLDQVIVLLAERGFQLNGEYAGKTNGKTPLKCLTCEYEWGTSIGHIKSGTGCPSCSGRAPVTLDQVKGILAERGFVLNGDYAGTVVGKTPLKCLTCEYEWSPRINGIKSGYGCPSCSGNAPVTLDQVKIILAERGLELNGQYAGKVLGKTPLKCLTCKYEWSPAISDIKSGRGCPSCYGNAPVTLDQVKFILAERGFELNGDYAGKVDGKTPLKCLTCEYEWSPTISDIKSGRGCPGCARDQWQKQGIYHLCHPDFDHQYIGISFKPTIRLAEHQQDGGPRGELARAIAKPYEFTTQEVHDVLDQAYKENRIANPAVVSWHEKDIGDKLPQGRLWFVNYHEMTHAARQRPARVPRFVAEVVETLLIQQYSNKFPADNPWSQAGKVALCNISKNSAQKTTNDA